MSTVDFSNQQIVVSGFNDLIKALDSMGEEVSKAKTAKLWSNALEYSLAPVLASAQRLAPRATNQLRSRIFLTSRRVGKASYVGGTYIGKVVSSARRDSEQRVTRIFKRGRRLVAQSFYRGRPVPVSQEYSNVRTPKHSYLRPAISQNKEMVIQRLGEKMQELLKNIDAFKKVNR